MRPDLSCHLKDLNPDYWKGEVFAYVGLPQNLKDLKEPKGSPFRHSLRAICTLLLDPRDPLLQCERMQGFAADPVYVKCEVFAYVGLPQNLETPKGLKVWLDLNDLKWPIMVSNVEGP